MERGVLKTVKLEFYEYGVSFVVSVVASKGRNELCSQDCMYFPFFQTILKSFRRQERHLIFYGLDQDMIENLKSLNNMNSLPLHASTEKDLLKRIKEISME